MSRGSLEEFVSRLFTDERFRLRVVRELDSLCREEGYELDEAEQRVVRLIEFEGAEDEAMDRPGEEMPPCARFVSHYPDMFHPA